MIEPKLRFKADDGRQFPDWEEKKIGELGTFTKGAPLSKADISECGSPLILYGELYTTYKEVAYNIQRKTQAVVDEKYYSCVGDVIIPTSGESAEDISTATCVMTPGVVLGGDLNIFRSNILDGRIVSYILNHQAKWKIAAIAQGKSIVHIQAKQLSNIHVKYPVSKAEQQKIAEFLSTIATVIEKQKETVSAWEERKKGVMQKLFSQEVRFKADDGSDFPEWEDGRLGELCSYRRGSFPQPYGAEEWYDEENGKPFIQVADVGDNMKLLPDTKRHISKAAMPMSVFVDAGTLIVTLQGSIGRIAITDYDAYIDRTLLIIQNIDSRLKKEFLQYALFVLFADEKKRADGGTIKTITKETLTNFTFKFPCLAEQQKIADCLSSLNEVIEKQKAILAAWEELKKSLLQQMFV